MPFYFVAHAICQPTAWCVTAYNSMDFMAVCVADSLENPLEQVKVGMCMFIRSMRMIRVAL